MTEMVERGAKALHALSRWSDVPWDQLQTQEKERLLRESRAVIEAIREPTNEMFEFAGYREGKLIWRAMIDTALGVQHSPYGQQVGEVK